MRDTQTPRNRWRRTQQGVSGGIEEGRPTYLLEVRFSVHRRQNRMTRERGWLDAWGDGFVPRYTKSSQNTYLNPVGRWIHCLVADRGSDGMVMTMYTHNHVYVPTGWDESSKNRNKKCNHTIIFFVDSPSFWWEEAFQFRLRSLLNIVLAKTKQNDAARNSLGVYM
jgi:hypothetical protein